MTIQRPDLAPAELQVARDAWMLVQRGLAVPTQYREAAMKVAAYCFACGYDHDEAVEARPVFIHPDGGKEGHPGVHGVNRTWTPGELAAWIAEAAAGVRPKGTGPMVSPGHSKAADESGAPLPALQRGDERTLSIGWLPFDADNVGEWSAILAAIRLHEGAFVRFRSSNHCTLPDCERHRGGASKWHLLVPLREPWTPPGNLNAARAEWKGELYAAARFAFHLVGEVSGRGFDRQLDQFLCRMYVGAPTDARHARLPREVASQEGTGFDVRACFAGLEALGIVDPAPVRAAQREAEVRALGEPWKEADGEPPMIAAFKAADLYVRPTAAGNHVVVCPWQDTHTTGRAGDSSTILFANGKFHCKHSHTEGSTAGGVGMREVLAMLPPDAQAAHARALPRIAAKTPGQGAATAPPDVRDAAYRAALGALGLDRIHRQELRARGLTDEAVDTNGYRTLPAGGRFAIGDAVVAAVGGDAAGVPGLALVGERWTWIGWPGLLVPVRGLDGRITALVVQRPDGTSAPISSRRSGGAAAVRALHVPLAAQAVRGRQLVVTVGALAADAATALSGRPVLGLPRPDDWRLAVDAVEAWGAGDVAVALGGGSPGVARCARLLVDALRESGARTAMWRWDEALGGLDNFLAARRRGEVTA